MMQSGPFLGSHRCDPVVAGQVHRVSATAAPAGDVNSVSATATSRYRDDGNHQTVRYKGTSHMKGNTGPQCYAILQLVSQNMTSS
jgi:hypothetical protein